MILTKLANCCGMLVNIGNADFCLMWYESMYFAPHDSPQLDFTLIMYGNLLWMEQINL